MIPTDIKAGVYQHYKGEHYLVLGLAHHSETEEVMVVYVPLYVREGPRMAVRPAEMFFGVVRECCPNCGGYGDTGPLMAGSEDLEWYCWKCNRTYMPSVPRFRYVGAAMPGSEVKAT